LRLPVEAEGTNPFRRLFRREDQRLRRAAAARCGIDEEILQIADRLRRPGRVVKEVVDEADRLPVSVCEESVERPVRAEDRTPQTLRRFFADRTTIEIDVSGP
jgi:hypothetical protein